MIGEPWPRAPPLLGSATELSAFRRPLSVYRMRISKLHDRSVFEQHYESVFKVLFSPQLTTTTEIQLCDSRNLVRVLTLETRTTAKSMDFSVFWALAVILARFGLQTKILDR